VIARCRWCRATLGPLTIVGFIEVGSGPGAFIYACGPCLQGHRLVPLLQHPDDSDGQPLYATHAHR
jgi:hypothetical protein